MTALRAWWLEVPGAAKQIIALFAGLAGGLVVVGKVLAVSPRLDAVEAVNARQDADILELQGSASRAEYLYCVDASERGFIALTPQDCYRDFQFRERR